jgi:TetR/AcrR family acrAB operon transcriptional repressor
MARKTREEAEKTRKDIIDAARRVFHQFGVGRSTLEQIASEAGVTRGAIYWHFEDKAALFHAMREDVFAPLTARADALLFAGEFDNPLDAIEASLNEFFSVLDDSQVVREVFEIMLSRCEYVGEFASVQQEVGKPAQTFLEKVESRYQLAARRGMLRRGLEPLPLARDTWAFTSGLLHLLLGCGKEMDLKGRIPAMISLHVGLRRAP